MEHLLDTDSLSKVVINEVMNDLDTSVLNPTTPINMYRIAHPDTMYGVYSNENQCLNDYIDVYVEYLASSHCGKVNTPSKGQDVSVFKSAKWYTTTIDTEVYGTCSIKQLLRWFTKKELRDLHNLGFKLYKFSTDTYKIYQRQTITDLSVWLSAEKEEINIKDFLTNRGYK